VEFHFLDAVKVLVSAASGSISTYSPYIKKYKGIIFILELLD